MSKGLKCAGCDELFANVAAVDAHIDSCAAGRQRFPPGLEGEVEYLRAQVDAGDKSRKLLKKIYDEDLKELRARVAGHSKDADWDKVLRLLRVMQEHFPGAPWGPLLRALGDCRHGPSLLLSVRSLHEMKL